MEGLSHSLTSARRHNRRRFLGGSLGLAAWSAAFTLACGGQKPEAKAPTTAPAVGTAAPAAAGTPVPKRGGRLLGYVGTTSGSTNPVENAAEGYVLSGVHVYDRLISFRFGKDSAKEYVLEAAQSVEMPDPTTVIFKLKPGMKYHDRAPVNGRAVSAEDVVKTQLYVKDNPRSNNSFQNGSMQSVEAPDAQTVVFKLRAPNAYLFSSWHLGSPTAQCIIPQELLDNLNNAWPVGSGPYQLAEYELNVRYLFRRYPGYREAGRGLPYIDEREYRVMIDPAAQEAAFRSEQIHVWDVPPTLVDQLRKDLSAKVEVHELLSPSMFTVAANVTRPPWNDIRVREAIYRILDKQQFLELLEGGKGRAAIGTLSPALEEYQLDPKQVEKYFRQDPRAARQLLEAAGFDFSKEVEMSTNNQQRNNQGMEIFQQQASRAGIKVRTVSMPFAEWVQQKMFTGNWEMFYASWPAYDSPLAPLRLQHTNTNFIHRFTGLKDPETDRLIEKAEQTLDRAERVKLVKDIQIALLEKYTPFVPTHSPMVYIGRWKYVRDYEVSPPNSQALYRTEMWLDK
jgi:peptide/nickel transport system substrate-binding protein